MTSPSLSRRGFIARAAAAAAGFVGGSFVGGLSTKAWAHPLHILRSGKRPVIDQPQSIMPIGLDEALRREDRAYRLPAVETLVAGLVGSGYTRSGKPVGADGVAGWPTAGGHVVSLGFAKKGSDEPTAFVVARWWDEKRRDPCPQDEPMPDVFSREVVRGEAGKPSLLRFRYVDEQGDLASREEIFDIQSVRADACGDVAIHTHPPGTCPDSCTACLHYQYYANVCSRPPPDCRQCVPCDFINHWAYSLACTVTCEAICASLFMEYYCCDWVDRVCCPVDFNDPLSVPDCI